MHRKQFLTGLVFSPLLIRELLQNEPPKKQVLLGLGSSGAAFVEAFRERGYNGPYRTWQCGHAGQMNHNEHLFRNAQREAPVQAKVISGWMKKDESYFVVSGLGGSRSTPLIRTFYQEAGKNGNSFKMLLTRPFSFEGELKNRRAEDFAALAAGDPRVRMLSLDELMHPYKKEPMCDVLEKHIGDMMYQVSGLDT